jgi:hypothetical protein
VVPHHNARDTIIPSLVVPCIGVDLYIPGSGGFQRAETFHNARDAINLSLVVPLHRC